MGFNLTRFSPIPTIDNVVSETPVDSGTITPVPTPTPRPSVGSCLNNSDPIPNLEHLHVPNLYDSFSDIPRPLESQRLTGLQSGPESSGTDKLNTNS